jgi:hypothetical protein
MRNLQFSTRKKLRISLLKFLPWFHKMKENGHEEFQRQPVNMKHKQASPYRPVNIPHFAESFLIVSSRQAENIRYVSSFNICINKKKRNFRTSNGSRGKNKLSGTAPPAAVQLTRRPHLRVLGPTRATVPFRSAPSAARSHHQLTSIFGASEKKGGKPHNKVLQRDAH